MTRATATQPRPSPPPGRKQRVGILTYHWVANFGANLQAFSVLHALRRRGLDAEFVNYRAPQAQHYYRESIDPAQLALHDAFVSWRLPQSPLLGSLDEVRDYCRHARFDLLLCGSDAVLRLDPRAPGGWR